MSSHRHELSYRYGQASTNGVDYGTCACGIPVMRQHTETRTGEAVPSDLDAVHALAHAEDASRLVASVPADATSGDWITVRGPFTLDTCDRIPVNCWECGFYGQAWTDRISPDPTRDPCQICN